MTITIDSDTCTRCGICAEVCPLGVIEQAGEGELPGQPKERYGTCISCGQCEAFCPTGALIQETGTVAPREEAVKEGELSPDRLGSYLKSRRSIRRYRSEPVARETIGKILDIARYAASGGNRQPVEWLVIYDSAEVQKVARLTIEWMRELAKSGHPMAAYAPILIAAWERGTDVICRNAPHLLIPHIPKDNPIAPTDAIIALTHVDLAAPAFGVGTCWAGFVAGAAQMYQPLQDYLSLPTGRVAAYAMMLGYPKYVPKQIPARNPAKVTWR